MIRSILGNLEFSVGWKTNIAVQLFGKQHTVIVKVRAYAESDGITPQQEKALGAFKESGHEQLQHAEKMLSEYDARAEKRFTPTMLLFNRDGGYALLCDDSKKPDEGVAVVFSPKEEVVSQDDYL